MATLQSRLDEIVGGKSAEPLEKAFGIRTVLDLLHHYPRRLAERGELTDLASLREDEEVTVVAEVIKCETKRGRDPRSVRVEAIIGDGRGTLQLVFFGARSRYHEKVLTPGTRGLFAGKVTVFNRTRQLTHPEYLVLQGDAFEEFDADDFASTLIPVYPATQKLQSWKIAKIVTLALSQLDQVPDPMPPEIRARRGLVDYDTALRTIHRPPTRDDWFRAKRRLAWDEAFNVQLALAQRRVAAAANPAVPRPPRAGGLLERFDATLPFTLTAGQREVGEQLAGELAVQHPMHRLLQGEVGSGKTLVALRAMLQVVDAGGQAALLAPTEVLAQQHARSIEDLLGPLAQAGRLGGSDDGTRVALLTGSMSAAARKAALLDIAIGTAGIVVGTHALIQDQVSFHDLGLVVVDEQHRFGVEQRDALRGKADQPPHLLVMTATPIPRTVAMTVFGDLETSTLTELPAGRLPISTTVVPAAEKPAWMDRVWQRVREEVDAGHQAFVVCPRIGLGVDDDLAEFEFELPDDLEQELARNRPRLAVVDTFETLRTGALAGLRVAMLHGRLPPDERDRVMADVVAGQVDVLIATTVIEVGVDVPNATIMVVLDADRFGISQLHQLRGRIGRGSAPGTCLLVTDYAEGTPSRERLDAVSATTDGFELAQRDVEQRREGDVLGAAQSGRRSQLRLLSLLRDADMIAQARAEASDLVAADPALDGHRLLAAQVAALVADEQAQYLEKA